MLKHKNIAILFLAIIMLFTACGKEPVGPKENESAKIVVPENTIVRVGDLMVSKEIYEKYLAMNTIWYETTNGKEALNQEYQGTPVKEVLKELVVKQLLDQTMIEKYVKDNKYVLDEVLFKEKLAEQKKLVEEDAELKEIYTAMGADDAFYDYAVKASIYQSVYEKMINETILKDTERTSKLFSEYPVEVKAKHILVEKEETAVALKKKIDAGEVFEELAKSHSTDLANSKNGGDLGYFKRGTWSPEFDEVAFTQPVGSISAPIKTSFGYHLIKIEDVKTINTLVEEKEDDALIQTYKEMVIASVFEEYSEKAKEAIKSKEEVEVFYDRLKEEQAPSTGK